MLTEAKIAKAQAKDKAYKISDSGGLYIMVTPSGGKLWRLNYRHQGRQKTLAIGKWPIISLREAREAALDAKKRLQEGRDPSMEKKVEGQKVFGAAACSWFERKKDSWRENSRTVIWWTLQKRILPAIGQRPIDTITPIELDAFFRKIASEHGVVLAYRAKSICSAIFTEAVFCGLCTGNPVLLMRGRMPKREISHLPTILEPQAIGILLRDIDNARGNRTLFTLWCAMRMLPLVFVRPGELRLAEWTEINFADATWCIPAEKMKMNREHLVPLSRQALAILEEVKAAAYDSSFVFPAFKLDAPFSKRAMWCFLERIGYKNKLSPHGFRAMARTLLHERLHFSPDAIEAQLAHRVPDRLGATYNRAQHLEERTRMMQAWADYLDNLKYT